MTTLYTVTVDTEEEWDWASGWPIDGLSTKNIGCLQRFQETCTRHGAAVTYFVNHAVLQKPGTRRIMEDVAKNPGVEIGMHIHPWNTPPVAAGKPVRARETFLHNLPPDLIRAKMATVYDSLAGNGWKPTSFRGGRYSSGEVTQEFLQEKGFVADASPVPYSTWREDGAPDYRNYGLLPVRRHPRRPGEQALWEIPLTLAFSRQPFALWAKLYDRIATTWLARLRLIGLAERTRVVRKVWLNFEDPLGQNMIPFLDRWRRLRLPCVCFTLHSSSLMAGGNGYTPTQADAGRLLAYVDQVLKTVAGWEEFRPATVSDVAAQLEKNHHAHSWN